MSFEQIVDIFTGKIYPALLVLFFFGLTIFIHELGHLLMALRRKMVVERFSIGFGPKIFGWTKNGVEYRLSWIPFGGYVALPQMMPMEALEGKSETKAEDLPQASPESRIYVALAGPIMNLGLAVILASIVYYVGLPTPINPSVVGYIEPGSREETLGIRVGDHIVKAGDQKVQTWDELNIAVALSREPTINVVIERDGQRQDYLLETELNPTWGVKTINLYPQGRPFAREIRIGSPAEKAGIEVGDKFLSVEGAAISTQEQLRELIGKRADMSTTVKIMRRGKVEAIVLTPELDREEKAGRMGVVLGDEIEYQLVRPGPTPLKQFVSTFDQMWKTVKAIVHHKETGVGLKSMSGPVGIAGGWWLQIRQGGIMRGVWFAVILNISLAVFNLLPIPVLDGGHILFATFEAFRQKPANVRFVHATTMTFAVLLISFMLYVTFFDIQRFLPIRSKTPPKVETNQPTPSTEPAQP